MLFGLTYLAFALLVGAKELVNPTKNMNNNLVSGLETLIFHLVAQNPSAKHPCSIKLSICYLDTILP